MARIVSSRNPNSVPRAVGTARRLDRVKTVKESVMKFATAMLFLASLLALGGSTAAQDSQVLSLEGRVELPNVKGRIDHFSVDVKGQRLFMAGVGPHRRKTLRYRSAGRYRRRGPCTSRRLHWRQRCGSCREDTPPFEAC